MHCTIAGVWFTVSMLSVSVAVAQGPVSEVVKMTVARKASIKGLKTFSQPGVELEVGVQVPGKPLLSIDLDKCKLRRFVDDKGTDLSAGAPKGFFGPFQWSSIAPSQVEDEDAGVEPLLLQRQVLAVTAAARRRARRSHPVAVTLRAGSGERALSQCSRVAG